MPWSKNDSWHLGAPLLLADTNNVRSHAESPYGRGSLAKRVGKPDPFKNLTTVATCTKFAHHTTLARAITSLIGVTDQCVSLLTSELRERKILAKRITLF